MAFLIVAFLFAATGRALADSATPAATMAATPAAAPASLQGFMNYADFTWVNGNTREHDFPLDGKFFSPELLFDTNYTYNFANPKDNVVDGSTCVEHSGQVDVEHLGVGGDFHIPVGDGGDYVRARLMTEFGNYAEQIPRDDETPARGAWNVIPGVQYLTEAYGGYHIAIPGTDGMNIDMGQFPSYVGLFSFYDSENWCYQASYVSSNTPWFFTGMRIQFFPNDTLKIEPWLINGWQTYGSFNNGVYGLPMDLGMEIRWAPNPSLVFIFNNYAGADNPNSPSCTKYHTDDSAVVKYMDDPKSDGITKMAFSLTCDAGMQTGPMYVGFASGVGPAGTTNGSGGALSPTGGAYVGAGASGNGIFGTGEYADSNGYVNVGPNGQNGESFLGAMFYNRIWFAHDTWAFTFGGGAMENQGAYLALLPPINGDTGANYFADPAAVAAFGEYPGEAWTAWDYDFGLQYMPDQYFTVDVEYTHRASSLNYFVGPGGITSTDGWGPGAATGSQTVNQGYSPNLVQSEDLIMSSIMVHI